MRACCFCFPTVHKSWLYCLKTRLGLIICRRPPRVLSQIRPAGLHTFLHPVGILHHHPPSVLLPQILVCIRHRLRHLLLQILRSNEPHSRPRQSGEEPGTYRVPRRRSAPCPWHLKRPLRFLDRREGPQDTRGDRERAGRDLRHCPGRKPPFSMVKRGLVTFYNRN